MERRKEGRVAAEKKLALKVFLPDFFFVVCKEWRCLGRHSGLDQRASCIPGVVVVQVSPAAGEPG